MCVERSDMFLMTPRLYIESFLFYLGAVSVLRSGWRTSKSPEMHLKEGLVKHFFCCICRKTHQQSINQVKKNSMSASVVLFGSSWSFSLAPGIIAVTPKLHVKNVSLFPLTLKQAKISKKSLFLAAHDTFAIQISVIWLLVSAAKTHSDSSVL